MLTKLKGCNKILKSKYALITIIEIVILLIGMSRIFSVDKVDHVFQGDKLVLHSDDVEMFSNVINQTEGNNYFITPYVNLDRGIYKIRLNYKAEAENNNCSLVYNGPTNYELFSDYVSLSPYDTYKEYNVWVNGRLDSARIQIGYVNSGLLEIDSVEIATAGNSVLYYSFRLIVLLIAVNIVCYLWFHWERLNIDRTVLIGIFGTTILASCGLLGEYYQWGHDIDFHLARIEGLMSGLMSGIFPVRIQPQWSNGYGYAVSVMYGNATLLLPAILRMIGFTVQDAYKWFVFFINLGTAAGSYYCFHKISKSKNISLAVSVIYTLSVYRMCNIYIRAAVGEYTAMMFLPFIVLGFYYAFGEDPENENYGKHLWQPVLGFSGLLQSHMLSCQMVAVFIVLICLICIKQVFRKKTFIYLSKIALVSILVNLWFLIPLLQYMREDLNVSAAFFDGKIQRRGITIMEILAPIYNGNVMWGSHWDEMLDLGNKFPVSLGSSFLIIGAVYLITCSQWVNTRMRKAATVTFLLTGISVFLATNLFPYNVIDSFSKTLGKLIARGNIPFRYLSISGVLGALLGCFLLIELNKQWNKSYVRALAVGLCLIAAVQSVSYTYEVLFRGGVSIKYDSAAVSTEHLMGGEYVYLGTNTGESLRDRKIHTYDTEVISYNKNYNTIKAEIKSTGNNPRITVPLFYYIGYEAYDVNTNEKFVVSRAEDDNNRVAVALPTGYQGTVVVRFGGTWYWDVAEIISLLSAILLIISAREFRFYCVFRDKLIGLWENLSKWGEDKIQQLRRRWEQKGGSQKVEDPKKVIFWNMIVTIIAFAVVLALNFHTEYTSDDFHYHFFYDTEGNPGVYVSKIRLTEVVASMLNHWKMWNGRVVAHGMLQIILTMGNTVFKIFNSFMFILLGTLIYRHSTYGKRHSASLLILIYVCMWFFLPQFGLTVLWASGAANYLWMAVLILAFSFIYRVHLINPDKIKNTTGNAVLIGIFGMLAGCTNENSGGAVLLLCLMFLALYRYNRIPIPKWAFSGIGGCLIGCVVLLKSPGNNRVSAETDLMGLFNRWKDILKVSKQEIAVLILILCIICLFCIAAQKSEDKNYIRVIPIMYFMAAGASICALVLSPSYPERAWFIGTVFFIVVAGCIYDEVLNMPRVVYGILTFAMVLIFILSFRAEFKKVNATYVQVKEGIDLIEGAKADGRNVVWIPLVHPSDSKYDAYNGTGYIRESADDWLNAWMAKYYEIDAIYGYERIHE